MKEPAIAASVGDSGGLYGIKPSVFDEVPGAGPVINLNLTAEFSYQSYTDIINAVAANPQLKYVLLVVNPIFTRNTKGRVKAVERLLSGFFSPFYSLRLPSLAWRPFVVNDLYYGLWTDLPYGYKKSHESFDPPFVMEEMLRDSGGWLRYPAIIDFDHSPACKISWDEEQLAYFRRSLDQIAAAAEKHDLHLGVFFSPVKCFETGVSSDSLQVEFDRFAMRHPEVFIPWDVIERRDASDFQERWHLNEAGSLAFSKMVAGLMAPWMRGEGPNYYQYEGDTLKGEPWNGVLTSRYVTGEIKSRRVYAKGVLDGETRTFYKSGTLMALRTYRNGLLEGPAVLFSEDSRIMDAKNFSGGREIAL